MGALVPRRREGVSARDRQSATQSRGLGGSVPGSGERAACVPYPLARRRRAPSTPQCARQGDLLQATFARVAGRSLHSGASTRRVRATRRTAAEKPCAWAVSGSEETRLPWVPLDLGLSERRVRPWFEAGLLADVDGLLRAKDDRFYLRPETTVYQVTSLM
jgi:hypothetical protein